MQQPLNIQDLDAGQLAHLMSRLGKGRSAAEITNTAKPNPFLQKDQRRIFLGRLAKVPAYNGEPLTRLQNWVDNITGFCRTFNLSLDMVAPHLAKTLTGKALDKYRALDLETTRFEQVLEALRPLDDAEYRNRQLTRKLNDLESSGNADKPSTTSDSREGPRTGRLAAQLNLLKSFQQIEHNMDDPLTLSELTVRLNRVFSLDMDLTKMEPAPQTPEDVYSIVRHRLSGGEEAS